MAIVKVPVAFTSLLLIDKFGRRTLLMVSASGLCLACLLVGISFVLKDHGWLEGQTPYLALLGLLVNNFNSIGFVLCIFSVFKVNLVLICKSSSHADVYCVLFNGHGRNTISFDFRDIPHKHKRVSRKCGYFCRVVDILVCFLYFQLLPGMELCRNIFHIDWHLCFHGCVCGDSSTRNQGENP